MPPKKTAKASKSKTPAGRKPAAARAAAKPAKKAAPPGRAKKRAPRRKAKRRAAWGGFIRAFVLVLLLGGGLLYAVAPRGLNLLGLSATDSEVDFVAEIIKGTEEAPGLTSGQEPPTGRDEPVPIRAGEMERLILRIDDILRRAVQEHGLPPTALRLDEVTPGQAFNYNLLFQHLSLAAPGSPAEREAARRAVIGELEATLPLLKPPAAIKETQPGRWLISVAGVPTHELALRGPAERPGEAPPAAQPGTAPAGLGGPGRLLIVIDDIGENLKAVNELAALDFPVTFAVWPHSSGAEKCAKAAQAARREVIIHQPMEAVRLKQGPDAISPAMSRSEIRRIIRESQRLVPYAVGLNNHTGSKATQDRRCMENVLEALDGSGFYVLDSLTINKSVFYDTARQAGVPGLRRDVFLDNVQSEEHILQQLNTAARLAEKCGYAVVIGHPYPATVKALQKWQKIRNPALLIVNGRELLDWLGARGQPSGKS